MVLPPKLAPIQVAIVPIYKGEDQLAKVSEVANKIQEELKAKGISVKYDDDDKRKPGWKFAEYEMKGVPTRIAIGQRDLENGTVEVARRDNKTKETVEVSNVVAYIEQLLEEIQENLLGRNKDFVSNNTTVVDSYDDFKEAIENKGGFVSAFWDGSSETELKIKEETKATIRCIPFDAKEEEGTCIYSGKPSNKRVLFAKAY